LEDDTPSKYHEYMTTPCGHTNTKTPAHKTDRDPAPLYEGELRISGHWSPDRQDRNDFRSQSPRFSGDNLDRNLALVERLREVASQLGVSVAQVAIAWVGAQGDDIVPLVGARTRGRLTESLGAVEVQLTAEHLAAIEGAVPKGAAAGDRYDAAQMALLDSER